MEKEDPTPTFRRFIPVLGISLLLFIGVYLAYQSARTRPGTVILPGGITYIGQTPTPAPVPQPTATDAGIIPVPENVAWATHKGNLFPYTFTYPTSLSLGWFPNDPYDSVTVFYGNTDANTNIFFRVDDLTKLHKTAYIGKPSEYARDWWKDYLWKGVATVTGFTNSNGLTGYRASYIDDTGKTPYDHVFFVVPGRSDLVIWISGKLFTAENFNRIVSSVTWGK